MTNRDRPNYGNAYTLDYYWYPTRFTCVTKIARPCWANGGVMNKLLENDFDTIEDHMWDDYCRGFLAGEIIGMPTDENLKMVRKAEKLWKDDCYGYYQDVLDEVCEY